MTRQPAPSRRVLYATRSVRILWYVSSLCVASIASRPSVCGRLGQYLRLSDQPLFGMTVVPAFHSSSNRWAVDAAEQPTKSPIQLASTGSNFTIPPVAFARRRPCGVAWVAVPEQSWQTPYSPPMYAGQPLVDMTIFLTSNN